MRSLACTLLFLLLFPAAGSAQTSQFDPVVFLSTLNIYQYYGRGNVRVPEGMQSSLVDSVVSNSMTVAFSMLLQTDSADTWKMWLDFDADRYYRPRLTRIFAQRPVGEKEIDPFSKLRDWVETVQKGNIGERVTDEEGTVSWQWMKRTDYYLTIRKVATDTGDWLTLSLALGD